MCVCVCRENHAQDVVGREQICPLVLLNKICLIRGNSSISQGASQSFSFFYKTILKAHTSIPNVGIRVIISITRQNVKKIPAIIVEGACKPKTGLGNKRYMAVARNERCN